MRRTRATQAHEPPRGPRQRPAPQPSVPPAKRPRQPPAPTAAAAAAATVGRTAELEKSVAEATAEVRRLAQALAQAEARGDGLEAAQERISELEAMLQLSEPLLARQQARIKELEEQTSSPAAALPPAIHGEVESLQATLGCLEQELEREGAARVEAEAAAERQRKQLAAVEEALEKKERLLNGASATITEKLRRIGELEEKLRVATEEFEMSKELRAADAEHISALRSKLSRLEAGSKAAAAAEQALRERTARVFELEAELSKIAADNEQLQSAHDAGGKRISELNQLLSEMEEGRERAEGDCWAAEAAVKEMKHLLDKSEEDAKTKDEQFQQAREDLVAATESKDAATKQLELLKSGAAPCEQCAKLREAKSTLEAQLAASELSRKALEMTLALVQRMTPEAAAEFERRTCSSGAKPAGDGGDPDAGQKEDESSPRGGSRKGGVAQEPLE
eukprot:TRINITY_DN16146_c0_g5_i1.p1 TRINITY_DN16146_c0_g5~~TRINITY_DN16146_c0_g5_i1.p1  ORF type:complete len:452 (+),score=138.96 TRINITY_DN16146_c0_g5_i1:75-1430(+)